MLSVSAPVMAQDAESKAVIESVTKVIKSKPADLEDQVKQVYKKNKKNPEVLIAIARAYYENKDSVNAQKYIAYTLKADKKYGPAYILLGDMAAMDNDGGMAASQYQQAIYFDPKNPEAYYKYANVYRKISPTEAVAKLEELRTQRPDVNVDALAGRIYYASNDFDKAIQCFSRGDLNTMEERDLTDYAMSLYFKGKYQESLDIAKFGLSKDPRDAAYNRLAFFNCTDLKDYPSALQYADALFNKSDSAKFSYYDYTYYGNALIGNKEPQKAIDVYKKALEMEFDNQDKKAGVIKQLSDGYKGINDYANAISTYKEYMQTVSKVSATDYVGLGQLYLLESDANAADSVLKKQSLKNAEAVYNELEQKMPEYEEYTVYKKAQVNSMLDPETKEGLAKPFYEKLAGMLEPKETKDDTDKVRLVECYRYLGYYYLVQDDTTNSITYWNKVIELDPTNEAAKQVLQELNK